MAITAAALQTELSPTWPTGPQVLRSYGTIGTKQHWLISGGTTYKGTVKFVGTTASDNAATQATAVLAALALGPSGLAVG
jgi:hypothetical protein